MEWCKGKRPPIRKVTRRVSCCISPQKTKESNAHNVFYWFQPLHKPTMWANDQHSINSRISKFPYFSFRQGQQLPPRQHIVDVLNISQLVFRETNHVNWSFVQLWLAYANSVTFFFPSSSSPPPLFLSIGSMWLISRFKGYQNSISVCGAATIWLWGGWRLQFRV